MNEIVPELHDLLKLTTLLHYLSDWTEEDYKRYESYFPATKTWRGILEHHCPNPKYKQVEFYPTEPDTFYLAIADNLASALSRPSGEERGVRNYRTHKLWQPTKEDTDEIRLKRDQIINLFKFCSTNPSWPAFLEQYRDILKGRAEDANPGRNITSLYTHSKLTGQFYRLLKNCPNFEITPRSLTNKTQEEVYHLIDSKMKQWQLIVAKCKFHFFQNPFRARDLNIFFKLKDLIDELLLIYKDNVFFSTSDEIHLILDQEGKLKDIAQRAHEKGFWIESTINRRPLNELPPNPEAKPGARQENFYDLPLEITPPLCEICQAAKATKEWPNDYILTHRKLCPQCTELLSRNPLAQVVELLCEIDKTNLQDILPEPAKEELCDTCFNLRVERPKLSKLETWSRDEVTKVCWVKLNLDFQQLYDTLNNLYLAKLKSAHLTEKSEIRFSVIGEFQEDYNCLLQELKQQISADFSDRNVEIILDDFFCIKVDRLRETMTVLEIYYKLLNDFFPALLTLNISPLKLTIICTNSKFPFFEIWRIIKEPREDIFISLIGRGNLRAPINALPALITAQKARYSKSALHKLTKIEDVSEKLAELTFQNKQDKKDYPTYFRLRKELPSSLNFQSILTFAKLIED